MMPKDSVAATTFFNDYFEYIGKSEAPMLYHRWVAVSILAALLGRQTYFPFGHTKLYPNFYIMLVGSPGTRKGTALSPAKKLLRSAKYEKFAPDRLSPERFIAELMYINNKIEVDGEEFTTFNFEQPNEMFVMAPELGDFIGHGNFNFINLLTNLWDNLDEYKHPKLHGKSIHVNQPTINFITGTTPRGIQLSVPVEAIGQGFTSRLILVHGEPSGVKITFPEPVSEEKLGQLSEKLIEIKSSVVGEMSVCPTAKKLFERIYKEFEDIDDFRFKHYTTRRFTHVLKLAVISAASRSSTELNEYDALFANTLLHFTEQRMPKALGEFGKSKHSEVTNSVLDIIRNARTPLGIKDIWKKLSQDLNSYSDLGDIIKNLLQAGKIQQENYKGKPVLLPLHEVRDGWKSDLLIPEVFTLDERI